ncbi:unnamed protein product [Peronospora belbahrii]|uniref:Uncharacterized protein n=1 Tax=Peronospora belbahrii TaxID=622444 RepID=A0AAU9L332_9STRA|nr:unnamed protein product [Peronospora belbahrii]
MHVISTGSVRESFKALEAFHRTLPEFYDSLAQAFRMTVTRFSFNDLVSKLIAEEVRKKDSSNMEEATALHASKRQEQGKFEKKSSQGKKK